jgi:hypothetical protein
MSDSDPLYFPARLYNNTLLLQTFLRFSKSEMQAITEWTRWLQSVPDLRQGRFAWHEARNIFPNRRGWTRYTFDTASDGWEIYARAIARTAMWRLVLAADSVLRQYEKSLSLPEDPQNDDPAWPLDPFDEKPIRYLKAGEKSFIVYSVGPDGTDQKGDPLCVVYCGARRYHGPRDMGLHIVLPAPEEEIMGYGSDQPFCSK